MRRAVFGWAPRSLCCVAAALAVLAHVAGVAWPGAVVLGAGLAMSSTAIVLPMLAERELLQSRAGRDGFAVLLFQDLAFIPLVALVPLLATATRAGPCAVAGRGARGGGDRGDPGRRAVPDAAAVPRDRRRAHAGGLHHGGAADRRRHRVAGVGRPGCRRRSARSWRACCCRSRNTATSWRPTSRRSRGCCWGSSSSRSGCRRISAWRATQSW